MKTLAKMIILFTIIALGCSQECECEEPRVMIAGNISVR